MEDDLLHVPFEDAEVGHLTSILVTPDQARAILRAREGTVIELDQGKWVRLQPGAPSEQPQRVFHYYHGGHGGYGYVQARERELRAGLERALRESP